VTYTQNDVQERVERIKAMKAVSSNIYFQIREELRNMASGGNGDIGNGPIRDKNYPNKPDEFFRAVLRLLDEELPTIQKQQDSKSQNERGRPYIYPSNPVFPEFVLMTIQEQQDSKRQYEKEKKHFISKEKRFADVLRMNLDENGLNQSDLARSLKIHRSIVSNWLADRHTPNLKQLINLAYFFTNDGNEFQYAFLMLAKSVILSKQESK